MDLANGTNTVQTMQIQGCTILGACSDWSNPSNDFQPYGPTKPVVALAPDVVRTNPGRYSVTFSWTVVTNGRPVTVTVSDSACQLAGDQRSCTFRGIGYDTPVSVDVTAHSEAGAASAVHMAARTPAKLTPTINLSFSGQTCFGPGECGVANADTCPTGTACEFIAVSSTNWDATTMKCTFTVGGTTIGVTPNSFPTDTLRVTAVAYGAADQIVGTCVDTSSPTTNETATDSINWHDVSEPTVPTTP